MVVAVDRAGTTLSIEVLLINYETLRCLPCFCLSGVQRGS